MTQHVIWTCYSVYWEDIEHFCNRAPAAHFPPPFSVSNAKVIVEPGLIITLWLNWALHVRAHAHSLLEPLAFFRHWKCSYFFSDHYSRMLSFLKIVLMFTTLLRDSLALLSCNNSFWMRSTFKNVGIFSKAAWNDSDVIFWVLIRNICKILLFRCLWWTPSVWMPGYLASQT